MKRILLIILAMFALSSFYGKAQIADVRTLDYKSGNLYLDGNKVKKAAARDLFDNDMYKDFQTTMCVYHDDYGDYSTNEPTMDGTASLTYILSAYQTEAAKM